MTDARARIETAKRRNEIAELNRIMDEIEAELAHSAQKPEQSEEEKRYRKKKTANDIANKISIAPAGHGLARKMHRPDPLPPNASAKGIAASIKLR